MNAAWNPLPNANATYEIRMGFKSPIVVVSSIDGGQSFSYQTRLTQLQSADYPSIAFGPSGNPDVPQAIWVTWHDIAVQPQLRRPVYAAWAPTNADGEVGDFSAPQLVSGENDPATGEAEVAVGPAGQVMVTFVKDTGLNTPSQVWLALDPDGIEPLGFRNPLPDPNTWLANSNLQMSWV